MIIGTRTQGHEDGRRQWRREERAGARLPAYPRYPGRTVTVQSDHVVAMTVT